MVYKVSLDYQYSLQPRPRNAALEKLLDKQVDAYCWRMLEMSSFADGLKKINRVEAADSIEPRWDNGNWIPCLDAASIYYLIGKQRPKIYMEVGSGNSTKFARKAIKDFGLSTRIVSIDPMPRAEVDAICDEVLRYPLENVDVEVFDSLGQDDVLFVDNSHRSFQNSDVTVFFTEILPRLKRGVVYGVHDMFLPDDYPADWEARIYNEQYLMSAYLLGGHGGDEIFLPNWYIHTSDNQNLKELREQIFSDPHYEGLNKVGTCFWLKRA